ncbi:MAG: hypothetical protein R3D86_04385 [Emcibacteraceae bacterium]
MRGSGPKFKEIKELKLTCSVYLALTSDDISKTLRVVKEGDVILTDLFCPTHKGETIKADFIDVDNAMLTSEFAEWFKNKSEKKQFLFGYANSFYQSSLRPIAGYLHGIDTVLTLKGRKNVIFRLPSSLLWNFRTSNHYLAEYESSGVRLYDRHSVLLPYIENYLKENKVTYTKGKLKFPLQVGIFNPLRLWAVFLVRLAVDIKGSIKRKVDHNCVEGKIFEHVFIVRTVGQAITILPYLSLTEKRILIIIGSTYTDTGAFSFLKENTMNRNNIHIVTGLYTSFLETLRIYKNTFVEIFMSKSSEFIYKNVKINFTQAILETLVLKSSIEIYQHQICSILKLVQSKMLISLEQKSVQAYIDAKLARNFKMVSIQLQWCQQAFFNLPIPICSDFFICETPKVQEAFKKCWPSETAKIKYIGTIQGICNFNKDNSASYENKIIRLCIFTGVESDVNAKFLKELQKQLKNSNIDISVKLHPRDNEKYEHIIPEAYYIRSYKQDFSVFCSSFDLAITYPSGVISDLLYTNLPFIVFVPEFNSYQNTESDFIPEGIEIITSIPLLADKIYSLNELIKRHNLALENFRKNNGIITDIEVFDKNLDELIAISNKEKCN